MLIPIALRLSNFRQNGRSSDVTLLEDLFVVWTQTELNYSLISATIPTLRPFASNLNTQFGGLGEGESTYVHSHSKSSTADRSKVNSSFQMSTLRSVRSQSNTKMQEPNSHSKETPSENPDYDIQVLDKTNGQTSGKRTNARQLRLGERNVVGDARSVNSNDSQQLMIKKEVTYVVEHQTTD